MAEAPGPGGDPGAAPHADLETLARRGRLLVIETVAHSGAGHVGGPLIGGLGGLVAEIVTANEPRPVVRVGIEDAWGESAPNAWLLERHGLTPERVAARVRAIWGDL